MEEDNHTDTSKVHMIGQQGPELSWGSGGRGEAVGVETRAKAVVELEARQVWV